MNIEKIQHFYINKYIATPFSKQKFFLSYSFKFKALWYRNYKVASRTINQHFIENSQKGEYIYSSQVGYFPFLYKDFFKFAFVRNPIIKLISCWQDKVLHQNYFDFSPEYHIRMKNFEEFVNWVKTIDVNSVFCDEHLRAQHSLIDLNNVDFIGRFEHFTEDFNYVTSKINLPLIQTHHKNKTVKQAINISEEIEKEIIALYFKDFSMFYSNQLRKFF